MPVAAQPASPVAPPPSPVDDEPNALQRALAATRHAEDLQLQHGQRQQLGLQEPELDPQHRQAIEAHIDAMPELTDHKRRFLKSHPSLLTEPFVKLMSHAYAIAQHAGIADDTPAMDNAILVGVARDLEHHRALSQLTRADARPTPENAAAHYDASEGADALSREAEAFMAEAAASAPPPPPPAPARRSIPMSAPVSRETPMMSSGGRQHGENTLSAEERQIAHISFAHLPKHAAEYAYLQNRKKMREMKKDGRIQGDR